MKIVILNLFKTRRALTAIAVLGLAFINLNAFAQKVNVTVNILPPYSPYYSDYTATSANKVLLTIQNLTDQVQTIKLTGKLTGDNGVVLSTRNNYVPQQPIVLNARELKQLNGTSLKDIFDINNLNVVGIDKAKLAQSSRLPEGNYDFCLVAADYKTNVVLSAQAPMGCSQLNIIYPEPPVLVGPVQNATVTAMQPQTVVFNWINPGVVPIGTQYTIQMVEMPDVAVDPNQTLNAASIYALSQTLSSTSYLYSLSNLGLKPGKRYAWRVIANDPTGRTLFKNNGISAASWFRYGENTPQLAADSLTRYANLNIITPSCSGGNPTVYIGDKVDINVAWLWKEQLLSQKYFGTLDTMLLDHYTQMATGKGMVQLGKYSIDFHRLTNYRGQPAPEHILYNTTTPLQVLTVSYADAVAKKFVPGETYEVTVIGFDKQGNQLERITSCQFQLKVPDANAIPKLNVAGHLIYTFDQSAYYGANNASISLQLTESKTPLAVFDVNKPSVSATTDASGNFSAQLNQMAADTGMRRVIVRINTPYYAQPDSGLLVRAPKLVYTTTNNQLKLTQDPLNLGDVKTQVYNNTLTVRIKKGFPKNLDYLDFDKMEGVNYSKDIFIDAATIDTMARIPDSTHVIIYRKTKADDIPAFEGNAKLQKKGQLQLGFNNNIAVADGYTLGGASGTPQVVFTNLLCNLRSNDEYYIQVKLPNNAQTQKDELSAPETAYKFSPTNPLKASYNNSTTYNIISQKPPTAHVKGRVMYQWPSTPGVLHPYANKKIYVQNQYRVYASDNSQLTNSCVLNTTKFTEAVTAPHGPTTQKEWNLSDQNIDIQVGQAVTDANGYFDAEILVPTKMGKVNNVTISKSGEPCKDIPKKEIDKQNQKSVIPDLGGPVEQASNGDPYEFSLFSNKLDFSSISATDTKSYTATNSTNAKTATTNGAAAKSTNTAVTDTKSINITNANDTKGVNAVLGGNMGKMAGAQVNTNVQLQGMKAGPGADINEEEPGARNQSFVERSFHLVGVQAVSATDSLGTQSAAHFIVQPFTTVDLGTIVTNVAEINNYPVKLYTKDPDLLPGAKLVVYRHWASQNPGYIPDGEGSLKHPKKPLLNSVFLPDPNNSPAEWIIDSALNVVGDQFNLGNRRLWAASPYTIYDVQICPNPEGSGGYFAAQTNPVGGNSMSFELTPLDSRIAGRIINSATGKPLKNGNVTITVTDPKTKKTKSVNLPTDDQGYFELVRGKFQNFTWNNSDDMNMRAFKDGYYQFNKDSVQSVLAMGRKYFRTLLMKPNKTVYITTVDAHLKSSIPGYAVTPDSTITTNDNSQHNYQLALSDKVTTKVKLIPEDPAYFEETIDVLPSQTVVPPVLMTKRHHRMTFHLFTNDSNGLNGDFFTILINNINYGGTVKNQGKETYVTFDFENVSVSNYTVQIIDKSGLGFVPQIFNVKNNETKEFITYDVQITKGATIWGVVSRDGKPTQFAKVYLDYSTDQPFNDGKTPGTTSFGLLQANTNATGYYEIRGVPVAQAAKVKVHATLEAAQAVNGDLKEVSVTPGGKTECNLNLSTVNVLINNIYSYPLAIEQIEKIDNNHYKVTGMLNISQNNQSPFKSIGLADKVRIQEVVLTTQNFVNWEPQNGSLKLDGVAQLKRSYLSQYNVRLETPNKNQLNVTMPLYIRKSDKGGVIDAHVSITDNSFNYPSTYLSFQDSVSKQPIPFYLVDPANFKAGNKPVIPAIYNVALPVVKSYHLASAKGDSLMFSFIGFKNTKAAPGSSYIDAATGQMHLDVSFKGNVPHSNQGFVNVHLKDLALNGYSILPVKSQDAIVIDLQTWKLYVKDWTIDTKLGGIKSSSSYVATGIVDVPAKTFNLRNDLFVLNDFDVEKISLGGGLLNLGGIKKENAFLVFDEACGSDHNAHWRFSAVSQDENPVATLPLPAVAGKIEKNIIGVNYFQLVSFNNENIINLSPKQNAMPLYNNQKFTFMPASITSGVGEYNVTGSATFNVPRIGKQAVSLTYRKPKDSFLIDMNVGNFLPINFEGKGYVQFTSDADAKFVPDPKKPSVTTITGKVVEPGKFNPIPCTLAFGQKAGTSESDTTINDYGTIRLKTGYKLRMDGKGETGADNVSLIIGDTKQNRMVVNPTTKDWDNLTFSGVMDNPKANKPDAQADAMQDANEQTSLSFTVLGDINITSSQIKMSKVKTPLGDLNLTYDFPTYTLRGALHMKKVKFGSYDFTGDIQTTIGPDGMLMLGSGKLNTGTLFVEGFGIINIGVLFGNINLTPANISTVTQYSKAKNNFCWLDENKDNFKGFFLSGGLDVLDKHEKFNFVVASGYFNANLGVEASIGANFKKKNYMALVGAHGNVNAGLSSITGTSISGALAAHLTGIGSYTENGFAVNGDAGVTIKYQINQYIPFVGTEHIGGQKGAKIDFGVGGGQKSYFNFSLADDGNKVECQKTEDK